MFGYLLYLQTKKEETSREVLNEETPAEDSKSNVLMKINALIQNKDIAGPAHVWSAADVLKTGQLLRVKVVKVDKERARVWVSTKGLEGILQFTQPLFVPLLISTAVPKDANTKDEPRKQDESAALKNSEFRKLSIDMIYQILKYLFI